MKACIGIQRYIYFPVVGGGFSYFGGVQMGPSKIFKHGGVWFPDENFFSPFEENVGPKYIPVHIVRCKRRVYFRDHWMGQQFTIYNFRGPILSLTSETNIAIFSKLP